jgi:hypothetical protein
MSTQSHIDKVNLKPMVIPYPTHVGAPKIEPTNLTPFKKKGLEKVDKIMKRKYEEVLKLAETLQNSFEINQEVYSSIYKFEPIIGEIYHLYEDSEGKKVLSMISPSEWDKKYLYSVVLNSDMLWEKMD